MPAADRGDVWIVDLGLAAKVRPCLVLSVSPGLQASKGRHHGFGSDEVAQNGGKFGLVNLEASQRLSKLIALAGVVQGSIQYAHL